MYQLMHGDSREKLKKIEDSSVHSIVCDPPYELSFMGAKWDSTGIAYDPEFWAECLRVLKPGGYLLAFGAPRTYHRIAVGIEDAGFEIRDSLMWLFGSGFPKSHSIGKAIDKKLGATRPVIGTQRLTGTAAMDGRQGRASVYAEGKTSDGASRVVELTGPATDEAKKWEGWGTALKPAYESIIAARKPFKGTVAANVLESGVGGINIDGCRVPLTNESVTGTKGRWPANVILDEEAAAILDAQTGELKSGKGAVRKKAKGMLGLGGDGGVNVEYSDSGGASRFFMNIPIESEENSRMFYHGKVSKKERRGSTHTTQKPLALMRYLVRLVTPPDGTVLDPFMGSGTTGEAAIEEGFKFIGIEQEETYYNFAHDRIAGAINVVN